MARTVRCTAATRAGRLAKAQQFWSAAQTIETLADDEATISDAYTTLAIHAVIAAADVICCVRLGEHARGDDHDEAVALLATADRDRAKLRRRLQGGDRCPEECSAVCKEAAGPPGDAWSRQAPKLRRSAAMVDHDVVAIVERFNAAWNHHDLDGALMLMSDDCVFESTGPAPDGEQYKGREAVRRAWAGIFDNEASRFTTEAIWTAGDRVVQMWRYDWGDGHVRGIDVLRVADGEITEKLSYVKG